MNGKQKKILILPALFDHVDLIEESKSRGYEVITCDNIASNVGHQHADFSENISLMDTDGLIRFAKKMEIDAVTAFSTDIGAISATQIAAELGLVGNSVDAVTIMANKSKFRAFLEKNSFATPLYQTVQCLEEIDMDSYSLPIIIKPTDRSGSKGVCVVENVLELRDKFDSSVKFSFEKKVIVEEYIETEYKQIHGDGLVQNGKLIFLCLGDQFFGEGNLRFSPIATIFPSSVPNYLLKKIEEELRRFIKLVDYKNGGLNIEIRIGNNENLFFIEIAPRFGGNYIPKVISEVCNLNVIKYVFDIAIGNKVVIPKYNVERNIFQFILRSKKSGIFSSVTVQKNNTISVMGNYPIKQRGEFISTDDVANSIISVYIIRANDLDVIKDVLDNVEKYFSIKFELCS